MTQTTDSQPPRRERKVTRVQVARTEQLTPTVVRVVLTGDELADFSVGEYTDHYVKLLFPDPDGTDLPERPRAYTVRAWDTAAMELTLDIVVHGDEGLAGPWASGAQPGDEIGFIGPGGAYTPDATANWHLLVGDESALPAIAVALERIAEIGTAAPVHVFLEVEDEREHQELTQPAGARITWLHRVDRPEHPGAALVEAVRTLTFPEGAVHAFVHGDADFVRQIRRHLRVDRGIDLDRLSISGYWRRGRTDEGWRSEKRDWNREVETEEQAMLQQQA
ncbi:siderophore-interacting protein [Janibacter sp. G1551]|uniref:siderophore-interacting protein n=1 Tax=Janibacter sp. G1551 TaxID=3420440 RepID=UPI003CFD015A